jgi:hypothetical protein
MSLGVPEGKMSRDWLDLGIAHASVVEREQATLAQNTVLAGLLTIVGAKE